MPIRLRNQRSKYKTPNLPDGDFFLVDAKGFEIGPLNTDTMGDNGGGEYVWSNDSTSPVFLRVVRQGKGWLEHQDGEGVVHRFRIFVRAPA